MRGSVVCRDGDCQYVKWKWKRLYRADAWSLLQWHFNSSDWDDSGIRPERSATPVRSYRTQPSWAKQSHLAQINLCIFDLSLSLSSSRCDGWNWLIVVFLLSDWYKCRLAAIAELQVSTKGNNSFNYNDRNQTQGKQGIAQAKENIIRHWNIVLPRCSHASSERLP